jgi:hypothetical protein
MVGLIFLIGTIAIVWMTASTLSDRPEDKGIRDVYLVAVGIVALFFVIGVVAR